MIMINKSTSNNNQIEQKTEYRPLIYLLAGGLFLLAYYVFGARMNFFVLTRFFYPSIKFMPKVEIMSMVLKILFILPATVFLSLYFMKFKRNLGNISLQKHQIKIIIVFMIIAFLFISFTAHMIIQDTPLTDDEKTYEFQAKILKKGQIFAQSPGVKESFKNLFLVIEDNRYTGHYPLGHPIILAIGMLLGSTHLVPILFSALLILWVFLITKQLYNDHRLAILSALLVLISPFYLFTSSTLLSQTTSSFFLGLFMLSFLKSIEVEVTGKRELLYAIVAGLAVGVVFNVRPLTSVGFAFPFAVLAIFRLFQGIMKKEKAKGMILKVALMGAGFLVMILFTLWYNHLLNGNYFTFPVEYFKAFLNEANNHSLINGFFNLILNLTKMNVFLFGFPVSFLFIFIFTLKKDWEFGDKLSLAILLNFFVTHMWWWFSGVSDTGPIYYYELIIPMVILSARGIFFLRDKISLWNPQYTTWVNTFLCISILLSIITFLPERSIHLKRLTDKIQEPILQVKNSGIHHAVVFVHSWPRIGYVGGYPINSPEFDDDIIFCHLLIGEMNARVIQKFPDRSYYILSFKEGKGQLLPVNSAQLTGIQKKQI